MANRNRTTSTPRRASAAKATKAATVRRSYFNVMDNLNQALSDLRGTVQTLYAVDTHINDSEDHEACRVVLSRLLMADLGLVEEAERNAWRVVVEQKGGAQ
jgi:hypothetical protein